MRRPTATVVAWSVRLLATTAGSIKTSVAQGSRPHNEPLSILVRRFSTLDRSRLIGPHRIAQDAAYCYRCSVVCLYVCLSVGHNRELYKTSAAAQGPKPLKEPLSILLRRLSLLDRSRFIGPHRIAQDAAYCYHCSVVCVSAGLLDSRGLYKSPTPKDPNRQKNHYRSSSQRKIGRDYWIASNSSICGLLLPL